MVASFFVLSASAAVLMHSGCQDAKQTAIIVRAFVHIGVSISILKDFAKKAPPLTEKKKVKRAKHEYHPIRIQFNRPILAIKEEKARLSPLLC
ncbi:hypothetical protein ACLM5H_11610 [Fredinandcohnia humi]